MFVSGSRDKLSEIDSLNVKDSKLFLYFSSAPRLQSMQLR